MRSQAEGSIHSTWGFPESSMLLPAIKIYSFWQLSSINTPEFVFRFLTDGHLWYFQVWLHLTKTAMNILVQVSLCTSLLGKCVGIKPLSQDRYVYRCMRNRMNISQSERLYILNWGWGDVQTLQISADIWSYQVFSTLSILVSMEWYLTVVLIFLSLKTNDEGFFLMLLDICASSL